MTDDNYEWHKVCEPDGLDEGRVTTVTAGTTSICLSRFEGQWGALDNRCPHQGGPLGEGSIENGLCAVPGMGGIIIPALVLLLVLMME